jgi:hypothetical protein
MKQCRHKMQKMVVTNLQRLTPKPAEQPLLDVIVDKYVFS